MKSIYTGRFSEYGVTLAGRLVVVEYAEDVLARKRFNAQLLELDEAREKLTQAGFTMKTELMSIPALVWEYERSSKPMAIDVYRRYGQVFEGNLIVVDYFCDAPDGESVRSADLRNKALKDIEAGHTIARVLCNFPEVVVEVE